MIKAHEKPYVVIGSSHNWGAGASDKEAIANATKAAYMGKTEYEFNLYKMDPKVVSEYWIDGMGTLNWEWATPPEGEESMFGFVKEAFMNTYFLGRHKRFKNGKVKLLEDTPE